MEEQPSSFRHRLLAALCYWIGLLWIPIFIYITPLAVQLGFWNEFAGKPIAVLICTLFILLPVTVLMAVGLQIIYWLCMRWFYPHLDSYERAAANISFVVGLPLLIGAVMLELLPAIGICIWLLGLALIPIHGVISFLGGLVALEGKTFNIPKQIRIFR